MKHMSLIMGAALLLAASPLAAQTEQQHPDHHADHHADHSGHHQMGGETQPQSGDQTVTKKTVIVKRVHHMEGANPEGSSGPAGAPGTQCEGKIAETILDSESKVADGQVRKFKVTRCTATALTAEQKIAELQTLRSNVGGPNFPESDAESKAAFLQAIDARIAELKQPGG